MLIQASLINPTYLSEHMSLSIPIAKCSAPHVSSDMTVTPVCSPISYENAPYSMEMPSHYDNSDRMDCVTEDDGKLQEANVESLRSVVVPDKDNNPSYAAQIYAARMQAEKDALTFENEDF